MNYITTKDSEKGNAIQLAYQDFGEGQPIVFIHGWPLSQKMWEYQIPYFVNEGYRVITYDRRGFGHSDQPWKGYNYNQFASDLKQVLESLDLKRVLLVGFSMGGGEVARYLGNFGSERVEKAVLISSIAPFMMQTEDNSDGVEESVFDGMKEGIAKDRADFFSGFGRNFVAIDQHQERVSEAQVQLNWNVAMSASRKATLDCVDAFGKTDLRKDCESITIPCLILHGDDDAIVPFEVSGKKAHQLIKNADLKVIEGAPHGLTFTHHKEVNEALLNFFKK